MTYPPPPAYPPAGQPATGPYRGRVPRILGWISLALAVVLIAVGVVVLATKSLGKVNGFQRIPIASGGGTVNLQRTGRWVIYYEARNVDSNFDRIPNISIAMADPNGAAVQISSYGKRKDGKVDRLTYDYNG